MIASIPLADAETDTRSGAMPMLAAVPVAGAGIGLDGWFENGSHIYPLKVQYEDTDAGGVVYHANYLAYAERARSAILACIGVDQTALLDDGTAFVVAKLTIDYHKTARLGDVLHVTSRLLALGKASFHLKQIISTPQAQSKTEYGMADSSAIASLDVTIAQVRMQSSSGANGRGSTHILRLGDDIKTLLARALVRPVSSSLSSRKGV